jgi:trans-aconitate methyltransferase
LFGPAQETALRLALELVPQARRILDVGCGTGQLLRRARPCYPTATLVGVDLAAQMVAAAIAVTPTKLAVRSPLCRPISGAAGRPSPYGHRL